MKMPDDPLEIYALKHWNNQFNSLPDEVRRIACMSALGDQINGLKREKARLKQRYEQSLKEINAHIANLEQELRRSMLDKEREL